MKFKLRYLLLFFLVASVSLSLTRHDFVVASVVMGGLLVLAILIAPKRTRRGIAWGAILGIVGAYGMMLCYEFAIRGTLLVSNYTESNESISIVYAWRPYIIQIGTLVGSTCGVLLQLRHASLKSNESEREVNQA